MKLEEAIEILAEEQKDHHSFPTDIIGKAELLGIEALKLNLVMRETYQHPQLLILPGETKD